MGSVTLSESVAKFVAWCQLRYRPATVAFYRHYLFRFTAKFPETQLADVGTLDVEMFSVKRHPLLCVKRFFSWCVSKAKLLAVDPTRGVQLPRGGRRSRTLTTSECVRLRRQAAPALRGFLLAVEESGARPHEWRNARWEQVRLVGGGAWTWADLQAGRCLLRLDRYKGQARRENPYVPRLVPISRRLGRLLARFGRQCTLLRGEILHSSAGRAWTPNALRCAFRRLRARCKFDGNNDPERIVCYSYRHTLATKLARDGVNHRVLADFLGHAGTSLLSWYVHPTEEDISNLVRQTKKKRGGENNP